jgi:outer membrane protein
MSRITPASATLALVALASALSAGAFAREGSWMVSGGVSLIDPKSNNLALGPGTTLELEEAVRPSFDFTYMLRDHWGLELFASTFARHDLRVTSPTGSTPFGSIKLLPPTLSLQYHFNPEGRIRPFAGLGVNYTFVSDESPQGLRVESALGPAAQVGFDVGINERWYLNLSARYVDIDVDARLGAVELGSVTLDPVIYNLHFGYRLVL